MSEAWYRVALDDGERVQLVVAPGAHLGAAMALAHARAGQGRPLWAIAAEAAAPGEVPLGESIGKRVVVEREAPAGLPRWRWPDGVVPTLDGARRLGAPRAGFVRRRQGELHVVEATVAGDRLIETFLQLLEQLPAADNIEIKVAGHHDGAGQTEVWLTPRLDVKKAIRFLDDHDDELLGNGHVEVAIYLRAQRCTLRLSEHKAIVWLTEDAELAEQFTSWLTAREVPAIDGLTEVASVGHYHWRGAQTRARKKLLERLHRLRLRRVDRWTDAP